MKNTSLLGLFFGALLVNNYILSQFLGICPFLGVSKKIKPAIGMSLAVLVVMLISSIIIWAINKFLLVPLNLVYLRTIGFIVIIAAVVQFIEIFLKKYSPALYRSLGLYLPLISTNCAVLAVVILNADKNYTLIQSVVNALGAGGGFLIAMIMFAGVREKIDNADVPKSLQGLPITLIAASLVSLSFIGFQGLIGL